MAALSLKTAARTPVPSRQATAAQAGRRQLLTRAESCEATVKKLLEMKIVMTAILQMATAEAQCELSKPAMHELEVTRLILTSDFLIEVTDGKFSAKAETTQTRIQTTAEAIREL